MSTHSEATKVVTHKFFTEPTEPFSVVLGAPSAELQALWFSTQETPWNSLVVLAASPDGPALEVAQALFDVGVRASSTSMKLVDGRNVSLASSNGMATSLRASQPPPGRSGSKVLLVLPSVLAQPAAIQVALAADAVILCIEFKKTLLQDARRTLALLGSPERVIGCVGVGPR
jgi:hypothetical protein